MKHYLLVLAIAASPLLANAADVKIDIGNVRIQAPGVTITFGTRDNRGYYWDGERLIQSGVTSREELVRVTRD